MAVLYSTKTEAIALRSMCSRNRVISGHLFGALDDSYFYNDTAIEAFKRIAKHIQRRGEPPAFKLLCEDISLSEDSREFLSMAEGQAKTLEQSEQIVANLAKYRMTRNLYDLTKSTLQSLEKSKVDPEEVLEAVRGKVAKMSQRRSEDQTIFHIGRDSNTVDLVKDLIYGETNDNVIPTGFKTFDDRNGGFFRGSLVTIAGSTGSGKCVAGPTEILLPQYEITPERKEAQQKTITLEEIWNSVAESLTKPHPEDGYYKEVTGLTVDTTEGPKEVAYVYRTKDFTVSLGFENGRGIECTRTHRLMLANGEWCSAERMQRGDLVKTKDGVSAVVSVVDTGLRKDVFDISVPGPCSYYANRIVSHNSSVIGQLAKNQATAGYKVNVIPLEMSHVEMLARYLANITGIENTKILLKRLASDEKDEAFKRWRRFDNKVLRNGGRLTIYKPQEDMTIEALMAAIHSYNADITYIDYISLLKGADGEDQWRQLGSIARFAKIYAESHNKVMALAAQVNDEGKLRYSKAIGEHSSTAFSFVATKESREKGYLNIDMFKARNQQMLNFTLGVDYASMRIYDLSPEELEAKTDVRKGGDEKGKGGRRTKNKEYIPDLTE